MSFTCTACGCCCKRVGQRLDQLQKLDFPYQADEKGWCEKLVDNLCTVYDNRPDVCNISKMAEQFEDQGLFYQINAMACNQMQEMDGIDKSFRISNP